MNGAEAEIKVGNCLPLQNIPVGTQVHNIELYPGKGGQLVRSAGNAAQLMAKEVEKGTTISYKVSSGPDTTSVPDLTDMTEAQARNALDMAGFGVNVSYQENDSVTEGTVISWNPSGKQKPGATITVVIAKKSGKASVPGNLYGKSISAAVTALNNAGFYNIAFCDQNGNPVSGNENVTVTGVSPTGKQSTDSTITLTVSVSGSGTDSGDDSGTSN